MKEICENLVSIKICVKFQRIGSQIDLGYYVPSSTKMKLTEATGTPKGLSCEFFKLQTLQIEV